MQNPKNPILWGGGIMSAYVLEGYDGINLSPHLQTWLETLGRKERISTSALSLGKCEQIVRGSLPHNSIPVKIPRIRSNQCGEKQTLLGSITAPCDPFFPFSTSSLRRSWIFLLLLITQQNSIANSPKQQSRPPAPPQNSPATI